MNIMNKVTIRNLKLNKKRTIGTIIGITLSVALICAVAGMFSSLRKTFINSIIEDSGYYHIEIDNLNKKDLETLQNNRYAKNINIVNNIGYSKYKNKNENIIPYIHLYSIDKEEYFKNMSINLLEGSYPKNENEIIISSDMNNDNSYKIGDIITLDIGKRFLNGDYLDKYNFYEEKEELVNNKEYQFKIVGIYKSNNSIVDYSSDVIFTTNMDNYLYDSYIKINNPMDYKKEISKLLGVSDYKNKNESKYNFLLNEELLRWEGLKFSNSTIKMLFNLFLIIVSIIMFTSIFCIKNAFSISVSEKIKMISMLSSVGSTKKQIKKMVLKEGFYLGIIGIPLGILSGVLAVFILITLVNYLMKDFIIGDVNLAFDIPLIAVLISIILGIITIYLSAIRQAKKASKISPIEGLRNSNEIKIKNKKLKTPKIIGKIFNVGGIIAYKNLKRSKKKYRTTVVSLVVSILTFISMNTFINYGFNITTDYYDNIKYNISVSDYSNKYDLKDISKQKYIDDYTLHYYVDNGLAIRDMSKLSDYVLSSLDEDSEEKIIELYAINNEAFKKYVEDLKLNYNDVKDKGILLDYYTDIDDNGKQTKKEIYKYKENDTIIGYTKDNKLNIEIAKTTDNPIMGLEGSYYEGGYLIVNYDYYNYLDSSLNAIYINSNNPKKLQEEIEDKYPDSHIDNIEEEIKAQKTIVLIISIFLYGFITVITLIGVTNIFNTITSNIELRQREFATLKSIGMPKKEFNRMINLETIFYSFKSLFYGIILGLSGSYLIYKAFASKEDYEFNLPINAIIISIIFVFILVFLIMKFSINKINKQNIIETIRKENI